MYVEQVVGMNEIDQKIMSADRILALLKGQADQLRVELVGLRRSVARAKIEFINAQHEFAALRGNQLKLANEQLVIAAVNASILADEATSDFEELSRTSQRDALTNTPNRTLMLDRINSAILNARRREAHFAIFFLDIDNFKHINDEFGHTAGDQVIQTMARRLESVVRDSDTVSRHSGDEFLVLLNDIAQVSDAEKVAIKILEAVARPCVIDNQQLTFTASIGISVYADDGEDAATLISCADAAMYESKRAKHGTFTFYH